MSQSEHSSTGMLVWNSTRVKGGKIKEPYNKVRGCPISNNINITNRCESMGTHHKGLRTRKNNSYIETWRTRVQPNARATKSPRAPHPQLLSKSYLVGPMIELWDLPSSWSFPSCPSCYVTRGVSLEIYNHVDPY